MTQGTLYSQEQVVRWPSDGIRRYIYKSRVCRGVTIPIPTLVLSQPASQPVSQSASQVPVEESTVGRVPS